jgi:hypothetical protein
MPTIRPSNSVITVHLIPMPGSAFFETKVFRFRPDQAMTLGFESLGLTATAENGLFCAWAVHETHARLSRDKHDGVGFLLFWLPSNRPVSP